MYLTLGLKSSEVGGLHSSLSGAALIEYLSAGGKFVFSNNKLVNHIVGGMLHDAQPYAGRALQLGVTNELAIPIFYTLSAEQKQGAELGTGWVANGSHSYTGSNASSNLSDISTLIIHGGMGVEITFEITTRTAGSVEGKNAVGTYKVYKTIDTLVGASFSGTVIIKSVKEIKNQNSFIAYHDVGTNTMVQVDCSTLPPNKTCSFLNKTVNNILTTHTAFSSSDLTKLQANPNLLANLGMNGSATELDMVLVGDEGWYACAEETGPLAFNAKSKSNGTFYFKSTATTPATQSFVFSSPVGTSLTLNGITYNGNGITNVTIPGVDYDDFEFVESAEGVLTYFKCYDNQLAGSIPDLSANINLIVFSCGNNQLAGVIPNLSINTALQYLHCYTNKLTGSIPDLSSNTLLQQVFCYGNQLTDFAGGTIKVTNAFNASSNKLTVAAVDDILQGLVDGGTTGAVTIRLEGGTNGVPTNTAAIDTLRARGCTVTVNT